MLVSRHLTYRAADRAADAHHRAIKDARRGSRRVVIRRRRGLWRWEVVEL